MIDGIMNGKNMKKIFDTSGIYSVKVFFCSFLTFFKIFKTSLKDTLLNKKINDFIVISITTSFPDIYYDCLLTKKPIFSIYLYLLKSSYKLYKKIKYTIIDYVLTHPKDILHNAKKSGVDFDGGTIVYKPSLHIYIDDISFYNLYEI